MRKPPPPPPRLRLEELPTAELIARGQALMTAQNYKDAIDVYKLLLKREPQAEAGWREALAKVYLERAKQLADKAMYREAAIIWENLPSLCGQAPHPELYVSWLLHTGQYPKAMRAYVQHTAALSGAGELEARLAALALAGQKEILQALPQDAPLRRLLSLAQAALRAYSQGEAEAVVRDCLQNIPIRSPYRDLRQTLSALLKLETDPAGAPALVERIPPTSPYHDLAVIVRAVAAPKPAQVLLALDATQRDLAVSLFGLDARQLKLLKESTRLGEHPKDKTLFDFITNNLALLDREQARHAALALLSGYPRGQSTYTQWFGPLTPFETHRLAALRAEQTEDSHAALREWQTCVSVLTQDARHPDDRLMIALILRQMAKLSQHEEYFWGDPAKPLAEYLEKSLEFDPDDRDVYLQLATLYREAEDDKAYHAWVERAVKQFPDDPQVLIAAVVTATARKSYKKAAGFAKRVLDLDPINTKARALLINAHLAHARKQLIAGKYPLVEKELNAANQLERDTARTGVIEIHRGLLAFRQVHREQTQHWLREGLRLAGSPFLGWVRLAVEASRLDLEPELFVRDLALGDPRKFTVSHSELLTVMKWINAYHEEGVEDLGSVLEDVEKPLKRAIKALRKEEDLLLVCEALHQAPHYELLEYVATGALSHYPERPLFIYYQIYGRAEGDADELKDREVDQLEAAMRRALSDKNHRAKMLIERFLEEYEPDFGSPFGLPMSGVPHDFTDMIEELRDMLEQVPPAMRDQMLDMMLKGMPMDKDMPPELQRNLIKAVLLGGMNAEDLVNDDGDIVLPMPGGGGRGGRPNRRRS